MAKKTTAPKKRTRTAEKSEAKNENKVLIIFIFAIIGIFGIIWLVMLNAKPSPESLPADTVTYRQFVFFKSGNYWQSLVVIKNQMSGESAVYNISFHHTPYEVMNISSPVNSRNETVAPKILVNGARQVYLTMDPEDPSSVAISGVEIAKIIGRIYRIPLKASITRPNNKTDAPIITCANVTGTSKVLLLKLGNETAIKEEMGCVVVEGTNPDELLRASEKLVFELLKIL
jgi:hypothetical protein